VGGPIVPLRDEAARGKAARKAETPGPSARHSPSSGAKGECVKGIDERRTTKRIETDDRASEHFVVCAGQRVNQEGLSPSGARMRGVISKGGGNALLAGEYR